MKAIILAAGYGTRLEHLGKETPKGLLPVAGKPLINYVVEKLEIVTDITEIYLVTNNKFFKAYQEWLNNYKTEKNIKIINDNTNSNEERLGAIGDTQFVIEAENIDTDTIVVAGDHVFEFDFNDLVADFKKHNNQTTIAVKIIKGDERKNYAILTMDDNNKIIDLIEKPDDPKTDFASIPLYLYSQDAVKLVKKYLDTGNKPDAPGYFIEWLYKENEVYGYVYNETIHDIGSVELYEKADKALKEKKGDNN